MDKKKYQDLRNFLGKEGINECYEDFLIIKRQGKFFNLLIIVFGIGTLIPIWKWDEWGVSAIIGVGISCVLCLYSVRRNEFLQERTKRSLRLTYILFNEFFGEEYDFWLEKNECEGYKRIPGHYGTSKKLNSKTIYKGRKFNKSMNWGNGPFGNSVYQYATEEEIKNPNNFEEYDFLSTGKDIWKEYLLKEESRKLATV